MKKIAICFCVYALLVIGFAILTRIALLAMILAFVVFVSIPIGYARWVSRKRVPKDGLFWRGFVSLSEAPLVANRELFPEIAHHPKRGGWGRKGLTSGKLDIASSGLNWVSGGWSTPQAEVTGKFHLPWDEIGSFEFRSLNNRRIRALGGIMQVKLARSGQTIYSEYWGSQDVVSQALESARSQHAAHPPKRPRK